MTDHESADEMAHRLPEASASQRDHGPATIGIDLVAVAEVQTSISMLGDRYLNRIFTSDEQRDARGQPSALAIRFAAKEATLKALKASR